jgi:hypothetical protein
LRPRNPGMFQCIGQSLVDLSGRSGEAMFRRHRQTGANQLDSLLTLAHPGPGVSLVAKDAGLQVDALCGARLLSRGLQQAECCSETPCRAQMSRCSEAFSSGLRRCLRCGKCRGCTFPAGQRLLPTTLKFQHSCQPAFRIAESK